MSREVRSKMFQKYGAWLQANYAVDRTDKTRHRLSALKKDYDEFAAEHEYPVGKIIGIAEFFRREAKLPIEKAGKAVSGRAVVIGLVKQSMGRVRSKGKPTPKKATAIELATLKADKPIAPKSTQVLPQGGIRAIETRYKGYRFRSRLEARWAVFFDHLGIEWEYEPQGYVLSDGSTYLPDFWLPDFDSPNGMYVEVKPKGGDLTKAMQFARDLKAKLWIAEGMPGETFEQVYDGSSDSPSIMDCLPAFNEAPREKRRFTYFSKAAYLSMLELGQDGLDLLMDAADAARSARFEHGEKGAA